MIKINAIGDTCPIPVIKTKEAMEEMAILEELEVLVDNEIAVTNVSKFAASKGATVTSEQLGEKQYSIHIKPSGVATKEKNMEAATGPTIVVLSSSMMGEGNEELGKVLMKGFIFALSKADELPKQILCYNGGATLTTEGSDSLEDFKEMETNGVEILTCGTCLDYYGLKDKLKVGSVTNMYSILEAMSGAGKILKP